MIQNLLQYLGVAAESATEVVTVTEPSSGPTTAIITTTEGSLFSSHWAQLGIAYAIEAGIVLAILLVSWLIATSVGNSISKSLRKAKIEETLALFFGKFVHWGILVLAVLACLQRFGINTASFAAVLAAAGFAIGLALQGTLSNFSSGIMLLIFRPFKVGDFINVGSNSGVVREIDVFSTAIDTLDNRRIILPNGKVYGEVIENVTFNDERRVDVDVGVHYKENLDETRAVLKAAAESVANRLPNKPVDVVLVGLNSSSVDYKVRVWGHPKDYWQIREEILVSAKKALDTAGITIPFPQLDVHFDRDVKLP